ncbi:Ig-like domain-containing protein [Streptomyces sp. NBC_01717]|uniref:Ig-like domain-containing protein n=1 Tax=Streptomyces sp. NBC_01717 TaxID=2975918 RepID=UPI003FCD0653
MKLLSKPKHGTTKLNKGDGTVTHTPRVGFEGTDKFRYSLRLEGSPGRLRHVLHPGHRPEHWRRV